MGVRWVGAGLGSERDRGWAVGAGRAASPCCLVRLAAFFLRSEASKD